MQSREAVCKKWLVPGKCLTNHMCMQDVQSGLQSARASQSYIQGLFRQQQPTKPACDTKMEHLNGTSCTALQIYASTSPLQLL